MAQILVIDDDDQIRKTLREVLEREGHEVAEAPDGKVGMRIFQDKGADLVITDIIMPEKDGIETILELRKNYPDEKIIAISGGDRGMPGQYLSWAKSFGANRTLTKPFNREEMLEAVRDLLE